MGDDATFRLYKKGLMIFDAATMVAVFASLAVLTIPRLDFSTFNNFFAVRLSIGNVMLFAAMILVWHASFRSFDVYSDKLVSRPKAASFEVFKAAILGSAIVGGAGFVFDLYFMSIVFLLFFLVGTVVISVGTRFISARLAYQIAKERNTSPRLLIVGINSRSLQIAEEIQNSPQTKRNIVGFVDDCDVRAEKARNLNYAHVSTLDDLPIYLRENPVDEVLIALPLKSRYDDASMIFGNCEEQGITVRILADVFQYRLSHSRTEQLGQHTVIRVFSHGMVGWPAFFKRATDIVGSGLLLVALLPLFIATAVAIKISGPGPVFFRQNRIGLNKQKFPMIKFRTMVEKAEALQVAIESLNEASGPAFKIKDDPRITSVGKFLRRTSIDELPQLINVLRGDMSLVGPRPLPLRDYAGFTEDWHRRRVSVRPGMTGLWQVESRDHSSFDNWMRLDMKYIDNWSSWLDIKILFLTVPAVLRGSGD